MITYGEDVIRRFPMHWMESRLTKIGYDFELLTKTKMRVVNILDEFNIISSRKMVRLD